MKSYYSRKGMAYGGGVRKPMAMGGMMSAPKAQKNGMQMGMNPMQPALKMGKRASKYSKKSGARFMSSGNANILYVTQHNNNKNSNYHSYLPP